MATVSVASKFLVLLSNLFDISYDHSCPNGFDGNQCETNLCYEQDCQHDSKCVIENNKAACR